MNSFKKKLTNATDTISFSTSTVSSTTIFITLFRCVASSVLILAGNSTFLIFFFKKALKSKTYLIILSLTLIIFKFDNIKESNSCKIWSILQSS